MANSPAYDEYLVDIGHGLKVGLNSPSNWQVLAKNGRFDMIETADFFRVVVLLERTYSEAKELLDSFTHSQPAAHEFPLWRVVGAALACHSDEWASLAMRWVPELPETERTQLRELLLQTHNARWASQKTRKLATRYAKQLSASS